MFDTDARSVFLKDKKNFDHIEPNRAHPALTVVAHAVRCTSFLVRAEQAEDDLPDSGRNIRISDLFRLLGPDGS